MISNVHSTGSALADSMGLTGHIDFADHVGRRRRGKTSSRHISCRASRAGVRPAEAVHVGDQIESDIDGAQAAGIAPILMDRFNGHISYKAHARVTCMAELEQLLATMRPV